MKQGMNLEEMTLLARCNGLHTQTFRAVNGWESVLAAKRIEYIDQTQICHEASCEKHEISGQINTFDSQLF